MKVHALFLVALVVLAAGADARSHLKHKAKAHAKAKAKYMTQSDYVAIANGGAGSVPAEVLRQFATPPPALKQVPNPAMLHQAESSFMPALEASVPSMRFAQAGSGAGSEAGAVDPNTATSPDEAAEICAKNAALGAESDEAGATPEAQMGENAAGGAGDAGKMALPADQPAIQMPDGRRLPLPPGCDPTSPQGGAASNALSQEVFPESERIPAGQGPCQACDNGPPPEPIKEIQILEWAPGKSQPLVLGKQLLTSNKTNLMLKVFDGEFDKELAAERKEQEEYNEEVHKANAEMKQEAVEYAGALLKSQELSQNQMVEQALQEALGVWGLEMSFGKSEESPEAAASAVQEEELAAETVAEADGGAAL